MKYKSKEKINIIWLFGVSTFLFILDSGFEFHLSDITTIHVLFLSISVLLAFTFNGVLSKEVDESENTFSVKYMYGLLKKDFSKKDLFSKHTDSSLICPGGPYMVSNVHIKLNDGKRTTIIYPFGTSNFQDLAISLKKHSVTYKSKLAKSESI